LRRSELVTITADPDDARRMHIRATRKGIALLQKGRELRITDLARHLERVSSVELATLDQAVEIMRRMLDHW
jgi:DNA-binding MarR family transcriptional regulator